MAGTDVRIAMIAAQWHSDLVNVATTACHSHLVAAGIAEDAISLITVPGSLELPLVAKVLATSGDYDAVLAFGCVIKGETEHFRLVADGAAQGLMRVALDTGVPVLNGVLAAYDASQAESRSGGEHGNTGSQTALAAIRMARAARAAGVK